MDNQPSTYPSQPDIAALIEQLTDSDRFVRCRAALTLGQLKERRAVGSLIATLQDNATVWDAAGDAAWALGEIGDVQAIEPLIENALYPTAKSAWDIRRVGSVPTPTNKYNNEATKLNQQSYVERANIRSGVVRSNP